MKPSRLRNDARSTAGTERSLPLTMFDTKRKRDAGCFLSFVDESCVVASYNNVDCLLVDMVLSTLFLLAIDETVTPNDR